MSTDILGKVPFADSVFTVVNLAKTINEYNKTETKYFAFVLPPCFHGQSSLNVVSGTSVYRDNRSVILIPHTSAYRTQADWEADPSEETYTLSEDSYFYEGILELESETATPTTEGRINVDEIIFCLGKGRKPQHVKIYF